MDRKVRKMRISDYFSAKSINPLINEDRAALHKKLKQNLQSNTIQKDEQPTQTIKSNTSTIFHNDHQGLKVEHIDH